MEPSEIALRTQGLTRRYGRREAVAELDVSVNVGDVYGFLGPNGAGKTTALRCMLGLIRYDSGRVEIFGETDPVKRLAKVGAIVETPSFHAWMSGRDNLRQAAAYASLSGAEADAEIQRVLERVGLTERAKDPAGSYSLGMRQRLGIARALLGRPKLLVLDEPTNGLDPRGMHEVRELVRSLALNDRITIVISSHLLAEVQQICNRVGILQDGRLRAEGSVASLLAAGGAAPIVDVGSPDRAALEAALRGMAGVELAGMGAEGRIRVLHPGLDLPGLTAALVRANVPIDAIVPLRRDLEEVFLEVTR